MATMPTSRAAIVPRRKNRIVGSDRTSYQTLRLGFSSVSTATNKVPVSVHSRETSSNTDSIETQARLHVARNATTTGDSDISTTFSKF